MKPKVNVKLTPSCTTSVPRSDTLAKRSKLGLFLDGGSEHDDSEVFADTPTLNTAKRRSRNATDSNSEDGDNVARKRSRRTLPIPDHGNKVADEMLPMKVAQISDTVSDMSVDMSMSNTLPESTLTLTQIPTIQQLSTSQAQDTSSCVSLPMLIYKDFKRKPREYAIVHHIDNPGGYDYHVNIPKMENVKSFVWLEMFDPEHKILATPSLTFFRVRGNSHNECHHKHTKHQTAHYLLHAVTRWTQTNSDVFFSFCLELAFIMYQGSMHTRTHARTYNFISYLKRSETGY